MKKVGKYVIITLLLLLGLCCVGVLYLFFVPNSNLFNITYINLNETKKTEKYSIDSISEISVNSRAYNVNVESTEDDKISLEVQANSFGFVLTKNQGVEISASIKNNVLTFNIKEPYGFATPNDSVIKLLVPKKKAFDITLSNKKALTQINDKSLTINNLTYSTQKGDLKLNNSTINGNLKLNLGKGECVLASTLKTNTNNVYLKLTTGRFTASNSVLGNIYITQNNRGVITLGECADIEEFKPSAGGQITAKKVSLINVDASDTVINIGEVLDGAIINLTGGGKVDISTLDGDSRITTNSGSILINKCMSHATVYSDEGNITVKEALKSISTKTNYGNINITFSKDAQHYSSSEQYPSRVLNAILHNGKITAKGVEHLGLPPSQKTENPNIPEGITITGNGRVHLEMSDVCGVNNVVGKNGNVTVIVNYSSAYMLTTNPEKATKGNVRVNLLQIPRYKGYRTKSKVITYVNSSQSNYNNTLTVSTTSGDLTILDTKLS